MTFPRITRIVPLSGGTVNDIPAKQNSPLMLDLLRAKSAAYDKAQRLYSLQVGAVVVVPLLLALLKLLNTAVTPYVLGASAVLFVLDWVFLEPLQKQYKTLGALFQEKFDCILFGFPWREARNGSEPAADVIDEWARRHPTAHNLRDWYAPNVGRLPAPFAAVACQRTNGNWNGRMRRRYAVALFSFAALVIVMVAGISIFVGATMLSGLSWLGVLLPLFSWSLREARKQWDSAALSIKVVDRAEKLWRRLLKGGDAPDLIEQEMRELQNDIYDQRKGDQQLFGWVYSRWRNADERSMRVSIEGLVREFEARGPHRGAP